MATLTFYGATEGVTGSCYLLQAQHASILLECGLVQGSREEEKVNEEPFPIKLSGLSITMFSLYFPAQTQIVSP